MLRVTDGSSTIPWKGIIKDKFSSLILAFSKIGIFQLKFIGKFIIQYRRGTYYLELSVIFIYYVLTRQISLSFILKDTGMCTRAVQRKMSFLNTAYFFPPETDFEYVP